MDNQSQGAIDTSPKILEEKAKGPRPSGDFDTVNELTAAAQAEPEQTVKSLTPKYSRLSLSDIELLLRLKDQGLKQVEIAEILKCSQATVSATLSRIKHSPELTQALARSESVPMLSRWIRASKVAAKRGDHRPAREFIELAHPELRPQAAAHGGGVGVTVVVHQPGQPQASRLPVIDVQVSPSPALPQGESEQE